ncbi:phosphatase PAP2 family protein [Arthrobacter sp. TMS2-4]
MNWFVLRCAGTLLGLTVLGVVFDVVAPLPSAAGSSVGGFIDVLGGGANFVAEIAAQIGWLILPVAAVWLLIRALQGLAVYVATVAVGLAVLAGGGMLLMTLDPLTSGASSGGGSVFSAGSIQLTVTCGVLLLVFLPVVPAKGRVLALVGAAAAVGGFDVVRVLAGIVPLGPVLGGWLLGLAWLAATVWAFRRWQQAPGLSSRWWFVLPVQDRAALALAPADERPLPGGRRSALKLAALWVLIAAGVTGAGFLITRVLTPISRMDEAAVRWFAEHRTDTLNALATAAGSFGTTTGIIGVLLITAALALAITRRTAPAVFLLVLVIGETALYLITGMIVGRPRPEVDHLSEGLPPTSSFPSGHVAAAVVMYSGLALLVGAWSQSRLRNLGFILAPLIVLSVGISRVYWGVHYPTDTMISVIFAVLWVYICWRYFQPARGSHPGAEETPTPVSQPAARQTGR